MAKSLAGGALLFAGLFVIMSGLLSDGRSLSAQEQPPATATLSGRAVRLVDRITDGYLVVDEIVEPVTNGRIAIPELGIDEPLSPLGSFSFRDLPVSADEDNPTFVTVIFTAPDLGSFTFLNLRLYPGTGPILTPQLTDVPRIDNLSRNHREIRLDASGELPNAGSGPLDGRELLSASAMLALVGAVLLLVGSFFRLIGHQRLHA